MTSILKSALLTAILITFAAIKAQAEVTAQQVWSSLRTAMTTAGFELSASEARSGNNLNIRDLTLNKHFQNPTGVGSGTLQVSISKLKFADLGDGTVRVIFPNRMPIILRSRDSVDGPFEVHLDIIQRELAIAASGKIEEIRHDYAAESIGLELRKLVFDGVAMPQADVSAGLNLADISGTSIHKTQTDRQYTRNLNVGQLSYQAVLSTPDQADAAFNMSGQIKDLNFTNTTVLPLNLDWSDPLSLLAAGASVDASWQYNEADSDFSALEDGSQYQHSSKVATGTGTFALNKKRVFYKAEATNSDLFFVLDTLPFPISLKLAKAAGNLLVPLGAGPKAQPFNIGITLSDFVASDMIWALFDDNAVLAREPMSLALEMSGTVKVLLDIFSAGALKNLEKDQSIPLEVQDLNISRLHLSGAGTTLNGAGSFAFDNSDLDSFDGLPRPMGSFKTELEGGNRLLNQLSDMGLLPKSEAMAMRMMLSMFTVPGASADTLKTVIEVTKEGHVLANGQRIR